MKNLFKNLMLVAVAAMAFTACTETNDEVNAVSKTTRYEFTANISDDTRSGFAGSETVDDKTFYKSEWHNGDKIKIFVDGYSDPIVADVTTEGKFSFELENAPESFFMTVCSPAEAWVGKLSANLPAEQTPLANSVDPKAHILRSAENLLVSNGTASVAMSHFAAYGKMTVNAPDFEISKVEVSFNGGQVYTLNATYVENNVFWFAVDSAIDVSTFTVTAYDAEDNAITKTVDVAAAGKELKFQWGHVSTFSVSGLKEYVAPEPEPEPEGLVYTAAEMIHEYSTNDVIVSFTGDGLEEMQIDFYGAAMVSGSLNVGTFTLGNGLYDGYCYYGDTQLNTITIVSTFEDGVYNLVFSDLTDNGGNVVVDGDITFTGLISGLTPVDLRTQLAAPDVTATVSGKTITLAWDRIEGAEGYTLSLYSPDDEKFDKFVTNNQYVFEAQKSNTKYYFKITATVSEDSQTYRTSDESFFEATTEDTDPKMELSESKLSFSADGGEKTFTVTLKNTDAAIEYTQEGDWFTVAFSGDTFTVNASANESETDAREGSITVTAGTLSQTIDVAQSKKSAVSTGGADGKTRETAYKFTTYTRKTDSGYPVMCLSGSEDNAVFEFESNGQTSYPQGLVKFNVGSWYTNWIVYHVNGEIVHDTVGSTRASNINVDKSYTYLTKEGNVYTVEYIMIVLNSGETIWYTFDGTFTF